MKEDTLMRIVAFGFVALAIAVAALAGNTKSSEENHDNFVLPLVPVFPEEGSQLRNLPAPNLKGPNLQGPELPTPLAPLSQHRAGARSPLSHCLMLGEAAVHDKDCLSAWQENRQRFLGENPKKSSKNTVSGGNIK